MVIHDSNNGSVHCLECLITPTCISAIFIKGNNFYDCLSALQEGTGSSSPDKREY